MTSLHRVLQEHTQERLEHCILLLKTQAIGWKACISAASVAEGEQLFRDGSSQECIWKSPLLIVLLLPKEVQRSFCFLSRWEANFDLHVKWDGERDTPEPKHTIFINRLHHVTHVSSSVVLPTVLASKYKVCCITALLYTHTQTQKNVLSGVWPESWHEEEAQSLDISLRVVDSM